MRLSLKDFTIEHVITKGLYFYMYQSPYPTSRGWPFKIKKQAVLDFLGWERPKLDYRTDLYSDDNNYYPEFKSREQALIFTITAITMHNETEC